MPSLEPIFFYESLAARIKPMNYMVVVSLSQELLHLLIISDICEHGSIAADGAEVAGEDAEG
jgi:hypothetical protein